MAVNASDILIVGAGLAGAAAAAWRPRLPSGYGSACTCVLSRTSRRRCDQAAFVAPRQRSSRATHPGGSGRTRRGPPSPSGSLGYGTACSRRRGCRWRTRRRRLQGDGLDATMPALDGSIGPVEGLEVRGWHAAMQGQGLLEALGQPHERFGAQTDGRLLTEGHSGIGITGPSLQVLLCGNEGVRAKLVHKLVKRDSVGKRTGDPFSVVHADVVRPVCFPGACVDLLGSRDVPPVDVLKPDAPTEDQRVVR
jgi:hypothetical protein